MRRPTSAVTAGPAVVLAVVASLVLAGCGSHGARGTATSSASGAVSSAVDISTSDCGSSWHPTHAGEQDLTVHNADQDAGEVQIVGLGRHRGLVYADIEPFGPGTTVALHVPLSAGRYSLVCLMEDQAPVIGPSLTLTGAGSGAPGVPILTQSQLVPSAVRYQAWTRRQLPGLVRATRRLRTLVDQGDTAAARAAWLTAHLDYQRLGASYDAFGDLGEEIDGLPAGLPGGTSSAHWTGFHRVERDLWGHPTASRLPGDATALDRAVAQLPRQVGSMQVDPLTLTLRAHEISENALQFQLTGEDDFGSHTDLDSVRAELVGTGAVLHALAAPISRRVAHPARIRVALRQALAAFTLATRANGHVPLARLPRAERERLDAALSLLTERLATIPATLEPRLTFASERLAGGD
ncbi:MAG TPA: EfeM/EfeO family lipoprotein [Nocardioides sp.]|jgi:iron uptake system component EfeO|uniref:EfeM/EfeO family lipoprotein n=1 Tax=Nocardioides sp. TaxID=35761 RepID=UPI002E37CCAE|nr:EfeM/EfeO family lipoprotein [Nocardioides sp.]HEX3931547.1 EfeM/EfeO family lipoprotein [Nocardioides sp.]